MRALRLLGGVPALAAALTAATATVAPPLSPAAPALCAAAPGWAHHVALVVEHGNGASLRLCIGFDGPAINGEQLLHASGLEYGTAGYGSLGNAVCQIDSEPASYPPSCWTSSSPYWAVFTAHAGGGWTPAAHAAGNEQFADGDAEGFRYDPQSNPSAPVSAAGTCSQATASAPPAAVTSSGATGASPATGPAAATAAASASAAPSRTPGVASVAGGATRTPTAAALNPGLLLGVVLAGALAGLLLMQLLLRRRRA